jgi:hypothetical protein
VEGICYCSPRGTHRSQLPDTADGETPEERRRLFMFTMTYLCGLGLIEGIFWAVWPVAWIEGWGLPTMLGGLVFFFPLHPCVRWWLARHRRAG